MQYVDNQAYTIKKKKTSSGPTSNGLMTIGMILFVILSIYNSAQFGASFSYVLLPSFLFIVAYLMSAKNVVRKRGLLIFGLFGIYVLSTVVSPYVSVGRDTVTFFILCCVYVIATSFHHTDKTLRISVNAYILVAATCSCNVVFQWVTKHYYQPWFQRSSFYFMGVFKDPNYTMAFIVPATFLAFAKLSMKKNKFRNKLLLLCSIAASALACLATASRGSILALFISCALFFVFSPNFSTSVKIKYITVFSFVLVVSVYLALAFLPEQSIQRFIFLEDGSGRLDLWSAALQIVWERPLIGGGMNAGNYFANSIAGNASHNVFIDILCDSGFIGLFWFIIFLLANCFRAKKENIVFQWTCCAAFLIPLFFINGFNTTSFYLPLILLSIFSNYNMSRSYTEYL